MDVGIEHKLDAFLAKPSAVCVWFKRCPLIGGGPELVRSMPAPTQRQLLADGFMKQRCIIIIRALLLMPSLNGCFAIRVYLFSKFDWFVFSGFERENDRACCCPHGFRT